MRTRTLFLLLPLSFVSFLVATNPTEKDYAEHLSWNAQTLCHQQQPSVMTQTSCYAIEAVPPHLVVKMITGYSQRQNYIVFSRFKTNFLGQEHNTIGIGKIFIPL